MGNEFIEDIANIEGYELENEPITEELKPEKPKDVTHVRFGCNSDGSIRWVERYSAEYVELIGKPDLVNRVEKLIADVDKLADEYLNSAVLYPVNGKVYKPKWADTAGTYWGLLQLDDTLIKKGMPSSFPMVIKDATQLPANFVTMERADLENLMTFLIQAIQENYNDKTSLIGELREIQSALVDCVEYEDYEPLYEHYLELEKAFNDRDLEEPYEPEPQPEPEPEILDEEKEDDMIEENEETQDEGDLS